MIFLIHRKLSSSESVSIENPASSIAFAGTVHPSGNNGRCRNRCVRQRSVARYRSGSRGLPVRYCLYEGVWVWPIGRTRADGRALRAVATLAIAGRVVAVARDLLVLELRRHRCAERWRRRRLPRDPVGHRDGRVDQLRRIAALAAHAPRARRARVNLLLRLLVAGRARHQPTESRARAQVASEVRGGEVAREAQELLRVVERRLALVVVHRVVEFDGCGLQSLHFTCLLCIVPVHILLIQFGRKSTVLHSKANPIRSSKSSRDPISNPVSTEAHILSDAHVIKVTVLVHEI